MSLSTHIVSYVLPMLMRTGYTCFLTVILVGGFGHIYKLTGPSTAICLWPYQQLGRILASLSLWKSSSQHAGIFGRSGMGGFLEMKGTLLGNGKQLLFMI